MDNNYHNQDITIEDNIMDSSTTMNVIKRDGKSESMDYGKVIKRVNHLSEDLLNVNKSEISRQIISQSFDGVKTEQLDLLAAETCANLSTKHYDYGTLAARYIISNLHKNTSPSFSEVTQALMDNGLINEFYYKTVMNNKEKLNSSINYKNDYNYTFFGFKTLERAYLMKINGKIMERPQHMIMRVCVAIHSDNIKEAIKNYNRMAEGYFTHATPTLYNMGTNLQQGSSCFLLTMKKDSIAGIYETLKNVALISKNAGGIGLAIHDIRAKGSKIRSTNGISNGIVPMIKVFNETARYVDQGGNKRPGAFAMYVEPWHLDIEDFLMLKRNTGTEQMRARDLFYGLWIPDLFMKRVESDADWTLMCPDECPGLQNVYGDEFEALYTKYEKEGRGGKTIKAQTLWGIIIDSQIETGTPYMLYKDACNMKSNQKELGTIKSSNLCTEIIEYTSPDEIAVCNLASIALPKYICYNDDGSPFFNFKKLEEITKMTTRNLNKIIDINYNPVIETKNSNQKHRPIGIGVQGLADTFALMRFTFESDEAKELNKKIFAHIYLASLEASMDLSRKRKKIISDYKKMISINKENEGFKSKLHKFKEEHNIIDEELKLPVYASGSYSSFIGSPIHKGQLQYDLWNAEPIPELKERFDKVKELIKKHGIRNSLLVAPMPTASTSQILGNNECFEPYTSNIYKRRTLAGEFQIVNKHLLKDLIKLGIWNDTIKDKIILNEGSIQNITEIPEDIKKLYKTVWEIKQKVIIDMAYDRGVYIDQSQSMNIFMANPTYANLSSMHFYGWKKGLKTGMYYLRSKSKVQAQKFSVDISKVSTNNEEPIKACRRDNPDCDSCGA